MAGDVGKVETLYKTNFRNAAATLRVIADDIEHGKYGNVTCVSLVLLGDTMEVFGMGEESEAPAVGMLLQAGVLRMARAIEEHGRE